MTTIATKTSTTAHYTVAWPVTLTAMAEISFTAPSHLTSDELEVYMRENVDPRETDLWDDIQYKGSFDQLNIKEADITSG